MRSRRVLGIVAAVMLSGGIHLAGSGIFAPENVEISGGGAPAPARLGSSFADMVAGAPGSVRPTRAEQVEPDDAARPVDTTETASRQPPTTETSQRSPEAPRQAVGPVATNVENLTSVESSRPTETAATGGAATPAAVGTVLPPADSETVAVASVASAHSDTTPLALPPSASASAASTSAVSPTAASSAAPAAISPALSRDTPDVPTRPEPDRMAATPPAEAVPAVEDDGPAPRSSLRPPVRPESARSLPRTDPEPRVAQTRQPAASGNAATDATRGDVDGTQTGTAAASAPRRTETSPAADPAEVANYPGEVLRRIARQGRPRVRHDGADAVIAFSIDARGGLATLAVAQTSGNATLDEAGLTILRRAAPFPPPPRGAQTRFSIAFGGR